MKEATQRDAAPRYRLQFAALQFFTFIARVPPFLAQVPAGQYPAVETLFRQRRD